MTAARRHLSAIPEPAQVLRSEIAELCQQIDARTLAPPGTAERAVYFWWWPATDDHSVDVLACLHHDAAQFLADVTADAGAATATPTVPADLPNHSNER